MCEPERGRLTSQKEADLRAGKRQTYELERGRRTSQEGADVRAGKRQTYELERGRRTSQEGADLRARKRQTYEPERGRRTKTRKSQTYESERGDVRSNLKEVELCLTAGGSPKGNTCGFSHPPPFHRPQRGRTTLILPKRTVHPSPSHSSERA